MRRAIIVTGAEPDIGFKLPDFVHSETYDRCACSIDSKHAAPTKTCQNLTSSAAEVCHV